jgi:hypothetical protein
VAVSDAVIDIEASEASLPEGIDFAYEEATRKLSEQLGAITDLDVKLGVAIGVLAAVIAALATQHLPPVLQGIVASWLVVGLVQGTRAFLFDRYADAPVARTLVESYANRSPQLMRGIVSQPVGANGGSSRRGHPRDQGV